jgi:flagellum-specific peptidoglycan hydrolase FlgJ
MIGVDEAAQAIREIVENLCKIKRDWILRLQASPSAQDDIQSECRENSQTHENSESRGLHIVFTVSPLRHMSDGAHGNNLSKATLQLAIDKAIHEIVSTSACDDPGINPAPSISYFPSYEIVMDELRDYRFYDNDMAHLSKVAEEYIFERMAETYCSEKTREDIKQIEKFLKSANHRIQDANSPATAAFLQKLHTEAQKLERQIAGLELNV